MRPLTLLTFLLLMMHNPLSTAADSTLGKTESILGVERIGPEIHFHVVSNGCTTANSFILKQDNNDGVLSLTLQRLKPDFCKRMPMRFTVSYNVTSLLDSQDNNEESKARKPVELLINNPLKSMSEPVRRRQ